MPCPPAWRRTALLLVATATALELWTASAHAASPPVPVGLPITFGTANTYASKPDIDYDAAGNFVVAWNAYLATPWCDFCRNALVRRQDRYGSALGESALVNQSPGDSERVWAPRVGVGPQGNFIVTWTSSEESRSEKPFARVYAADGSPMTDEFVAASDDYLAQGFGDAAALSDGTFVLVWHYNSGFKEVPGSDILVRTFDSQGAPLGSPMTIDEPGRRHGYPQVDEWDAGFVASWWANEEFRGGPSHMIARRFSANAAPSGTEFEVSQYANTGYSALGVSDSGSFMVAWENHDGEKPAILATQYAGDDTALGSELAVSTDTTLSSWVPAVAGLSDGGFVIVWASYPDGNNTDETSLFGRTFTAAGEADPVFQIETRGGAAYPAVAGDPFGGFTVVWAGRELTAQRFTHDPHCADADGNGSTTASDAFVVLRGALETASCAPCVCDIDASNAVTASDALRVLHAATGAQELSCPACG